MKYVNSTVTVPIPHELDLVIVAVYLELKIILKIKKNRSYRSSSNSLNIRGFIKYWIPARKTRRRGISSSGRARALHVRGSGIVARILHKYSCYVVHMVVLSFSFSHR